MEQVKENNTPSFACGMCGKCFAEAEQCRVHIQLHTGSKPFPCIICWPLFYDMPGAGGSIQPPWGASPPMPVTPVTQEVPGQLSQPVASADVSGPPQGETAEATIASKANDAKIVSHSSGASVPEASPVPTSTSAGNSTSVSIPVAKLDQTFEKSDLPKKSSSDNVVVETNDVPQYSAAELTATLPTAIMSSGHEVAHDQFYSHMQDSPVTSDATTAVSVHNSSFSSGREGGRRVKSRPKRLAADLLIMAAKVQEAVLSDHVYSSVSKEQPVVNPSMNSNAGSNPTSVTSAASYVVKEQSSAQVQSFVQPDVLTDNLENQKVVEDSLPVLNVASVPAQNANIATQSVSLPEPDVSHGGGKQSVSTASNEDSREKLSTASSKDSKEKPSPSKDSPVNFNKTINFLKKVQLQSPILSPSRPVLEAKAVTSDCSNPAVISSNTATIDYAEESRQAAASIVMSGPLPSPGMMTISPRPAAFFDSHMIAGMFQIVERREGEKGTKKMTVMYKGKPRTDDTSAIEKSITTALYGGNTFADVMSSSRSKKRGRSHTIQHYYPSPPEVSRASGISVLAGVAANVSSVKTSSAAHASRTSVNTSDASLPRPGVQGLNSDAIYNSFGNDSNQTMTPSVVNNERSAARAKVSMPVAGILVSDTNTPTSSPGSRQVLSIVNGSESIPAGGDSQNMSITKPTATSVVQTSQSGLSKEVMKTAPRPSLGTTVIHVTGAPNKPTNVIHITKGRHSVDSPPMKIPGVATVSVTTNSVGVTDVALQMKNSDAHTGISAATPTTSGETPSVGSSAAGAKSSSQPSAFVELAKQSVERSIICDKAVSSTKPTVTKFPYVSLKRIDTTLKNLQTEQFVNIIQNEVLTNNPFKVPFSYQSNICPEKSVTGNISDSEDGVLSDTEKVYVSDSDATVLFGYESDHDVTRSPSKSGAQRMHTTEKEAGISARLRTSPHKLSVHPQRKSPEIAPRFPSPSTVKASDKPHSQKRVSRLQKDSLGQKSSSPLMTRRRKSDQHHNVTGVQANHNEKESNNPHTQIGPYKPRSPSPKRQKQTDQTSSHTARPSSLPAQHVSTVRPSSPRRRGLSSEVTEEQHRRMTKKPGRGRPRKKKLNANRSAATFRKLQRGRLTKSPLKRHAVSGADRLKKNRKPRVGAERLLVLNPEIEMDLQEIFTPGHKLRSRSGGNSENGDSRGSSSNMAADVSQVLVQAEVHAVPPSSSNTLPSPSCTIVGRDQQNSTTPIVVSSSDSLFDGTENCELPVIRSPRRRRQLDEDRTEQSNNVSIVNFNLDSMTAANISPLQINDGPGTMSIPNSGLSVGREDDEISIMSESVPLVSESGVVLGPERNIRKAAEVLETIASDKNKQRLNLNRDMSILSSPMPISTPATRTGRRYSVYSSWKKQVKNAELRARNWERRPSATATSEQEAGPSNQDTVTPIFTPSVVESVKQAEQRRKTSTIPTPDMETTAATIAQSIATAVVNEPPVPEGHFRVPHSDTGIRKKKAKKSLHPQASLSFDSVNSDLNRFECKKCHAKFQKHVNLVRHKRNNCQDRFYCDVCGNSFGRKESLSVHKQLHTGESAVDCGVCSRRMSSLASLKSHMRIHTDEKPFECPMCGKTFRQQPALASHYRTHTGVRPFKCDQCPKSYRHHKNLYNHKFTHTGERRYVCPICNAGFFQVGNLQNHVKSQHGNLKPFVCEYCDMRFVQKGELFKHKRALHMDKLVVLEARAEKNAKKPFSCPNCHRGFTTNFARNRHVKNFCMVLKASEIHTQVPDSFVELIE